jgi:hypothetical protein
MNIFKHSAVLLTLALMTGAASAALIPMVNVLELEASAFRMPAHEADVIDVMPCDGCALQKVQVSTSTVYRVGGFDSRPMPLADVQSGFRKSKNKDDLIIYVVYDVATSRVNEIVIGIIE